MDTIDNKRSVTTQPEKLFDESLWLFNLHEIFLPGSTNTDGRTISTKLKYYLLIIESFSV